MMTFYCDIQLIRRGNGRPAVAAAAYRAGERIWSAGGGYWCNYSCKGGVVHKEILLPGSAPAEYADRAVLWNNVEAIEHEEHAWLAWELCCALPLELPLTQHACLVRTYARQSFVVHGLCADICIHDRGNQNPHAHIMLPTQPIQQDGSWGLSWVRPDAADIWRAEWEEVWRERMRFT